MKSNKRIPLLLRTFPAWVMLVFFPRLLPAQVNDTTLNRTLQKKITKAFDINPDSVLIYSDSLFRRATRIGDYIGIIDYYNSLGLFHWYKGNYAEAIKSFTQGYQLCIEHRNQDRLMVILQNMGMVYNRLGDYPKAIDNYLEALKLSESLNRKDISIATYNSLGVTYRNYGNDKEALRSYKESIRLAKETNSAINIAGALSNMGNLYVDNLEFDSAIQYLERAQFMFDSLGDLRGKIVCMNNLGTAYINEKKIKEAHSYYKTALELSRSKNFFTSEIASLQGMAKVYALQNNFQQAEAVLEDAIKLSININYRSRLVEMYKDIAYLYKQTRQLDKAIYYFEKHIALKDSIFSSESISTLSNLRIAYEVEKKEADIKLLTLDNEVARVTRNFAISGIILVFLVAGMIFFSQRLKLHLNAQLLRKQEDLYLTQQAVSFLELKNSKMKEEELLRELDYKNQSLSTYALNLVQKNEILEEVRQTVERIIKNPNDQQSQFKQLSKLVDYSLSLDKDWDDFKFFFNEVHHGFFNNLQARFPDISNSELKLCALLRLNMNMKQMATILRISPESVKMARHRLRKKFNLQTEENLVGFMMSI